MHILKDVTASLDWYKAIDEIQYLGPNLMRWATAAKTARACAGEASASGYQELLLEDLAKLEAAAAMLRASLQPRNTASVQIVSHETKGVAA